MAERTLILDSRQIEQKIQRIAHQIHEHTFKEKEIVVVGVQFKGVEFARRLVEVLRNISALEIELYTIGFEKDKPLRDEVRFEGDVAHMKNKVVFLVDDVINSGRTLIYAAKFLLDASPKQLKTATLVDRIHRRFPIHADFVGLTLSTNLKEHVEVDLTSKEHGVYLE
ncbi:MAG: phosphoribosyltransferase [Flavobacteriales bacterium]|nr:phosphoribosyltransferase [Flavobacteriales bacterium]